MTRDEALNVLKELKQACAFQILSDEYLKENGHETREDIGLGGEYLYGIWMVPENTVISMCEALISDRNTA